MFIGCPLGMMSKRGNFGISAAISLLFYVVFWACLIGGEKLADRNLISAELGGWFCIYVTGSIGLLLTFMMNNEISLKDIISSLFRLKSNFIQIIQGEYLLWISVVRNFHYVCFLLN